MRQLMTLAVVLAIAGGAFYIYRTGAGVASRNDLLAEARGFSSIVAAKGSVTDADVREIVLEMFHRVKGVKPPDADAIEVRRLPLQMTRPDCKLENPPPEFELLSTQQAGNAKNMILRCTETEMLGFHVDVATDDGRPFEVEQWTVVRR